jgi:IPTL-CTERM motif
VTVGSNVATGSGGGVFQGGGTLNLVNGIIAGNIADLAPNDFASGGGSLNASFDLFQVASGGPVNGVGNVLVSANPQLGPLGNNGGPTQTEAIPTSSPAHDAGNSAACPALDQRGDPRPATCSLGAFEPALPLGPVPTLSAWAKLALAALMAATGLAALGRRRA